MPLIAAAALAITVLALVAAALFWAALGGQGPASASDAIGAALTPAPGGLVVDGLRRDGRAIRAGLRVGDVVAAVNGRRVVDIDTVGHAVAMREVDLRVRRGNETLTFRLPPTERSPLGKPHSAGRG